MCVRMRRSSLISGAMFLAYQRDSQSRMTPTRNPTGWTFCPTPHLHLCCTHVTLSLLPHDHGDVAAPPRHDVQASPPARAALCAMRRSGAGAPATGFPRLCSAPRRTLVGEMRMYLAIAFVSMNRRASLLVAVPYFSVVVRSVWAP